LLIEVCIFQRGNQGTDLIAGICHEFAGQIPIDCFGIIMKEVYIINLGLKLETLADLIEDL